MASSRRSNEQKQFKRKRHELSYVKLNTFRNEGALCDVILKTTDDGDAIYAHKCVIASNSEYFEEMFIIDAPATAAETEEKSIILVENVNNDVLRHLIDFIYTGELVTIDAENVGGILNGAEVLRLNDVRGVCIEFYINTIDDENCFAVKDMADSKAIFDLSEKCLNYVLERLISKSNCAAFLNADVEKIKQFIDNCYKACSAIEQEESVGIKVYEAVVKWVKHKESDRKHLLLELLRSIELTLISRDYFYQRIATEPLIESDPECMEFISSVSEYLICGSETSSLIEIAPAKPGTRNAERKNALPRIKCTKPNTQYTGKYAIDLCAILTDPAQEFQNAEWTLFMNENNFLKEWDEEWEDVNGPWREMPKQDW